MCKLGSNVLGLFFSFLSYIENLIPIAMKYFPARFRSNLIDSSHCNESHTETDARQGQVDVLHRTCRRRMVHGGCYVTVIVYLCRLDFVVFNLDQSQTSSENSPILLRLIGQLNNHMIRSFAILGNSQCLLHNHPFWNTCSQV